MKDELLYICLPLDVFETTGDCFLHIAVIQSKVWFLASTIRRGQYSGLGLDSVNRIWILSASSLSSQMQTERTQDPILVDSTFSLGLHKGPLDRVLEKKNESTVGHPYDIFVACFQAISIIAHTIDWSLSTNVQGWRLLTRLAMFLRKIV